MKRSKEFCWERQLCPSQKKKNEINEISASFAVLCTRLEERVGRLEDLNNKAPRNEKSQYRGPLCFRCGLRGHFVAQCFRPRTHAEENNQRGRGFQPPQYNRNPGRGQYDNSQNWNYYGRAVSHRGFGRGFDNNYRLKTTGVLALNLKMQVHKWEHSEKLPYTM